MSERRECAYQYCDAELTGRADQKYHSAACRVAAHRESRSDPREYDGDGTLRRCEWCEQPIPYPRQLNPLARYCSNAHKQAYYRECGGPPISAADLAGLAEALRGEVTDNPR